MRDPRPLIGEPLALDLVNTHWLENGRLQDLLVTPAGVSTWLRSAGLAESVPEDPATSDTLRATRDVLAALLRDPSDGSARATLNDVLAKGRRLRRLTEEGTRTLLQVDQAGWTAAWLAAENYLDLVERGRHRIRGCEHPQCVLWFFDTTAASTRRWCSMSICGNRAKAERHYQRHHGQRRS